MPADPLPAPHACEIPTSTMLCRTFSKEAQACPSPSRPHLHWSTASLPPDTPRTARADFAGVNRRQVPTDQATVPRAGGTGRRNRYSGLPGAVLREPKSRVHYLVNPAVTRNELSALGGLHDSAGGFTPSSRPIRPVLPFASLRQPYAVRCPNNVGTMKARLFTCSRTRC